MSILFRVQDWLADRVSWVQYPQIRRLSPRRALFRHAMPWPTRVLLILVGTSTLLACAIALFFLGLLAWATITA
jgi:hypothetical protein